MKRDQHALTAVVDSAAEDLAHEEQESAFAWECRVMAVAFFCSPPGVLFGSLVRLLVPEGGPAIWWLFGGGVLGMIFGGMLVADYWT